MRFLAGRGGATEVVDESGSSVALSVLDSQNGSSKLDTEFEDEE